MKNNTIIINLIVAIVVGALAFYGGMQYQKSQRATFAGGQFRQFGGAYGNRMMNNRPVAGEISSIDASTITVKMQDGSSKIVIFSDKTVINKSATGSASDLKTGEKVLVIGANNTDGSVTAQNIQLNPMLRRAQ